MSPPSAKAEVSPKPAARTRNTAETRARLLDATIALLVEKGYAKTSTWAVCERANASRGALLHHFPTRIHLLTAAVDHLAQAPLHELEAALARAAPHQQPHIFLDWLWSTLEGDLFSVGLELLTAARTEEELGKVIRAGGDLLQQRLEAFVRSIAAANGQSDRGDLASALYIAIPAVRGIGLDLSVGGDLAAHKRSFDRWRGHVEALAFINA